MMGGKGAKKGDVCDYQIKVMGKERGTRKGDRFNEG